jgi:spore coat polysaccharide biosynthesis protein SpsF
MSTVAIVQARMGSTRLPGKVLMDLGSTTVLGRVVRRLRRAGLIDEIVVATTNSAEDDAIVRECRSLAVACLRGSECDVLDRYYMVAKACAAEAVVRITSDCPVIDPELVDETIRAFREQAGDYASNTLDPTYPRGLDAEVLTVAALGRAWREARQPYEREHVTPYFYEHPELFRLVSVKGDEDYSHCRWTLDTAEDFEFLRTIYERFDNRDAFHWRDVLRLMQIEPQLAQLNAHVVQKELHAS